MKAYRALIQVFIAPSGNQIYVLIDKRGAVKIYDTIEDLRGFTIINYNIQHNGIITALNDWVDISYLTQPLMLTDRDHGTSYSMSSSKAYKKYIGNWSESYIHSSIAILAINRLNNL